MIRLQQLRLDALKSVDDLADETGLAGKTIRELESGETTSPRIDTLAKLSTYFDVPASELLRDTDAKAVA